MDEDWDLGAELDGDAEAEEEPAEELRQVEAELRQVKRDPRQAPGAELLSWTDQHRPPPPARRLRLRSAAAGGQ